MDEYSNLKHNPFKPDASTIPMANIPVFSSIAGNSLHFQHSMQASVQLQLSMDSMAELQANVYAGHQAPLQQHIMKHHPRQMEAEPMQLSHGFAKPSLAYSYQPACAATQPGFFNPDMHKHTFEDVLNSPPTYGMDPSINHPEMLPKIQYHQTQNGLSCDINHYPQEVTNSYIQNAPKQTTTHDIQLNQQKKHTEFCKVICKLDCTRSDQLANAYAHNDLNDLTNIITENQTTHNIAAPLPQEVSPLEDGGTIYKCGFCDCLMASNESLLNHLKTHGSLLPYRCGVCHLVFIEADDLFNHVQRNHALKPYACGMCSSKFHKNQMLKEHVESHLQAKTAVKLSSSKQQSGQSGLFNVQPPADETDDDKNDDDDDNDEEDSKGITEDPVNRNNCSGNTILIGKDTTFSLRKGPSKILMDDVDLTKDCTVIVEPSSAGGVRKKHLFKCNYCEKMCKDKGSMVSHVRTHTKGRPYECSTCHATFKQYAHLSDHVMTKHTKDRPFVCDRCAKAFNRKSHLQDHIRLRHTDDKLYHCSNCSATFEKRSDFSDHRRTHGKPPKYQCNQCPRNFRNVTDYERHIKSHTKEKRFECEVCHLTFGLLANAKKHMIKHSDDRPFKCETCPKAYHFEHDYKRHCLTHLNKKPFPCPDCYKSFKNEALLKKHAKESHMTLDEGTNQKLYQCSICGKSFTKKLHLDQHKKIHIKKKPFPCLYCYKTYGSEAALAKHAKIHEGQNLPMYNHSKDASEDCTVGNDSSDKDTSSKESKHETEDDSGTERRPRRKRILYKNIAKSNSTKRRQHGRSSKKEVADSKAVKTPSVKLLIRSKSLRKRNFHCSDCCESFMSLAQLKAHAKVHKKDTPSKDTCVWESTNETDMKSLEDLKDPSSLDEGCAQSTNAETRNSSCESDVTCIKKENYNK